MAIIILDNGRWEWGKRENGEINGRIGLSSPHSLTFPQISSKNLMGDPQNKER